MFNGEPHNGIVRLHSNSALDTSFLSGGGFSDSTVFASMASVEDLEIMSDGTIIVVGTFDSYSSNPFNSIVKLLSSGLMDLSFSISTGITGEAKVIMEDSFIRILISGENITSYNGIVVYGVFRIFIDGGMDLSFSAGFTMANITSIIEEPMTGNYLLGG